MNPTRSTQPRRHFQEARRLAIEWSSDRSARVHGFLLEAPDERPNARSDLETFSMHTSVCSPPNVVLFSWQEYCTQAESRHHSTALGQSICRGKTHYIT